MIKNTTCLSKQDLAAQSLHKLGLLIPRTNALLKHHIHTSKQHINKNNSALNIENVCIKQIIRWDESVDSRTTKSGQDLKLIL